MNAPLNAAQWLYDAHLTISGHAITWREIIGNLFGLAAAIGGMRRRVWSWPVNIVGCALLLTVFLGATFAADSPAPLFGQAGRQAFFIITSIYGWHRWQQTRAIRAAAAQDPGANQEAVTPRWASATERISYLLVAVLLLVVLQWLFSEIGAGFPAPRWYYWSDAWVFVGSMLATYAMARGWNDFWLAWIAVDLVGVPVLWHNQLYPSAIMFIVYGAFVIWGFVVWLRASRVERVTPEEVSVG